MVKTAGVPCHISQILQAGVEFYAGQLERAEEDKEAIGQRLAAAQTNAQAFGGSPNFREDKSTVGQLKRKVAALTAQRDEAVQDKRRLQDCEDSLLEEQSRNASLEKVITLLELFFSAPPPPPPHFEFVFKKSLGFN